MSGYIKVNLSRLLGERKWKMSDLIQHSIDIGAPVSRTAVQALYHEKSKGIQWDVLAKLCEALDCEPEDLLEYVPDEESSTSYESK